MKSMRRRNRDSVLQSFQVQEPSELLAFLLVQQVRKSRNAIKSLLANKLVQVNGKVVTQFNEALKKGDVVDIHKVSPRKEPGKLKGLTILYEDDDILVIDKEAKLLSISTDSEKKQTAYNILSEYVKSHDREARIFVLHRLDRDTSGLMIYAKTPEVQERMQKHWDYAIKKRSYIAIVEGHLEPADGKMTTWLTEDKNYVMHSSPKDNGGQIAITNYQTLKVNDTFSMLQLNLETGRKNQIRVQMQHAGHPIVGDKKYGSEINPIKRMALHANELIFIHPYTNERLAFKSPVPRRMQWLMD